MNMTIAERIKAFCEKYPEPTQFGFVLTWQRKDGCHQEHIGSYDDILSFWNGRILTRNTGKPFYCAHYKYDEELELMEFSYMVINCNVPKENENRKWEYYRRYFIPKEEKQLYDINGLSDEFIIITSSLGWETPSPRTFFQNFSRLNYCKSQFVEEFNKFTNYAPDLPPRFMRGEGDYYPWVLTEWYVHKPIKHNKSETQDIIDKLSDIPEISTEMMWTKYHNIIEERNRWRNTVAYYDKDHKVFRLYSFSRHTNPMELYRVYQYKDRFITAKNERGKWLKNGTFTSSLFDSIVLNLEDVYNTGYNSYLRKLSGVNTVFKIVNAMRNPVIEQLVKIDCDALANSIVNANDSMKVSIKEYLGNPMKRNGTLSEKFGLTINQIKFINEHQSKYVYEYSHDGYYNNPNRTRSVYEIIPNMRMLLSQKLSDYGEEFQKYFECVYSLNSWDLRSIKADSNFKNRGLFKKLIAISNKSAIPYKQIFHIWNDTYSTYTYLNRKPDNLDIYAISNLEDLNRIHDVVVRLKAIEDEERRMVWNMKEAERRKYLENKMKEIDEERALMNYEDDKYLIRIPNNLTEIVIEGSTLRHCVGGYTERHARGNTTIMFLRRKDCPDIPFYTIELDNNKNIVQIHGYGNKWLGNDPDAIPTVARWIRDNNIACTDQILRGTAQGYCGNNILVDMPEI